MKKTLFAFSVTVVFSIAVFFAIGLSGCDWFNTAILGKPSQTELAEREKQRQNELNRMDSIRRAETEKYVNLESKNVALADNKSDISKPYQVVLGCYEEQANINNMMNTLKQHGYTPYTFSIGGLTAVAAAGFDTESQAIAEMNKIENKDFCEDIWVYKKP